MVPVNADSDHGSQPVVITFTKWINGYPSMAGVVGGDVAGNFAGEVLQRQESTTNSSIFDVIWLLAIYDIEAGDQSFTALIKGGQNNKTNQALLDGTILGDGGQARESTSSSCRLMTRRSAVMRGHLPALAHVSKARSLLGQLPNNYQRDNDSESGQRSYIRCGSACGQRPG